MDTTCPEGYEYSAWSANVLSRNPGVGARAMSPEQRAVFLSNLNATPPVSRLAPDEVIVFYRRGMSVVLLAFVDGDGCVFGAPQIPIALFGQLIGKIGGRGMSPSDDTDA